jgi:hypothetical protein
VKPDDGIDTLQSALIDHFTSASARLFGWLKDASPGYR